MPARQNSPIQRSPIGHHGAKRAGWGLAGRGGCNGRRHVGLPPAWRSQATKLTPVSQHQFALMGSSFVKGMLGNGLAIAGGDLQLHDRLEHQEWPETKLCGLWLKEGEPLNPKP